MVFAILLLMTIGPSFASYLTVYGLMLLVGTTCYTTAYGFYVFGSLRASRSIHRNLIESVLGTTLRCIFKRPSTGLY